MPKINKIQATDSEYWMWPQSNEDATTDLNWTGESQEVLDKSPDQKSE